MKKVKFVILDKTGHTTKLVAVELANEFAVQLQEKGYLLHDGTQQVTDASKCSLIYAVPIPQGG